MKRNITTNYTADEFKSLLEEIVTTSVKKALDEAKETPKVESPLEAENDLLNIDEAAELTKLKKSYLYVLVNKQKIPIKSEKNNSLLFSKSELLAWLTNRQKK